MPSNLSRRQFQTQLLAALGVSLSSTALAVESTAAQKRPCILIRSSWQTVNIGDIAHTPGLVTLLEDALPQARLILWPGDIGQGVKEMLQRHFPKLEFAQGKEAVAKAIKDADFLLHGSGPSLVAQKQLAEWVSLTSKPFGIIGITLNQANEQTVELLNQAKFVFFRDSISLRWAKERGIQCPMMEFGPDAAFATQLANEDAATQFLRKHQLEEKQFLCCIPRLRYTPYWEIKNRPVDPNRQARNEEMRLHDHQYLVNAIEHVIENSSIKILLCPEDMTQMKVGKENILPRLSEKARSRVVWREDYWLTDEALSVYRRSLGLFGFEMHSPIMCIGHGIPAIVCRFPEQTSKGFMWDDIGLHDWLFQVDSPESMSKLNETVLSLVKDPKAAQKKALKAAKFTKSRFAVAVGELKRHLS